MSSAVSDARERHPEQVPGRRERAPVDVGEDDEQEALAEPDQGVAGVRKGRPLRYGSGQGSRVPGRDRGAKLLAKRPEAAGQDVWVQLGRVGGLGGGFLRSVSGQQLVEAELQALAGCPGAEYRPQARLPVDQGAVTIEAQRLVLSELHGSHPATPARRRW